MPYPVAFDVAAPERYDRSQAVLRLILLLVLSVAGSLFTWLFGLVYLALPVAAAILASRTTPAGFTASEAVRLRGVLRWLLAFYAYLLFLTDRFPATGPEQAVRFEVRPEGEPTAGTALLRLLTSIPSAICVLLLGVVAVIVWLVELLTVLVGEAVPASLYEFQRGVLRWLARLLAYHASLVATYPPFSLDTGPEPPA